MAGVTLTIDHKYDGRRKLVKVLQRLEAAGGDLEAAFADVGEHLLNSHRSRWGRQESPDGKPWAPLSEGYRKRKKRNQDKILILDGHLKDELRYQASARQLAFGTNSIYGATHQYGDSARGIPAREWLGLAPEDETEAVAIIEDHIASLIAG